MKANFYGSRNLHLQWLPCQLATSPHGSLILIIIRNFISGTRFMVSHTWRPGEKY